MQDKLNTMDGYNENDHYTDDFQDFDIHANQRNPSARKGQGQ